MALDPAAFLAAFPEFNALDVADPLLVAKLDDADKATSSSFGVRQTRAAHLLAAHLLAVSPFGVKANLAPKNGKTTYGEQLRELRGINAVARRVV